MKKHRFIRTIAAMSLACALLPVFYISAGAEAGARVSASVINAKQGETAVVAITLEENPGLWGLRFRVGYDHDVLTLKSAQAGEVFSAGEITAPPTLNEKEYVFVADRSEFTTTTANGALVTLTFEVKGDAKTKEYPVTIKLEDAIDADGNDVALRTQNGGVTVAEDSSIVDDSSTSEDSSISEGSSRLNDSSNVESSTVSGNPSNTDESASLNTSSVSEGSVQPDAVSKVEDGSHPNTGDATVTTLYIVVALVSLGAIGGFVFYQKRKVKANGK